MSASKPSSTSAFILLKASSSTSDSSSSRTARFRFLKKQRASARTLNEPKAQLASFDLLLDPVELDMPLISISPQTGNGVSFYSDTAGRTPNPALDLRAFSLDGIPPLPWKTSIITKLNIIPNCSESFASIMSCSLMKPPSTQRSSSLMLCWTFLRAFSLNCSCSVRSSKFLGHYRVLVAARLLPKAFHSIASTTVQVIPLLDDLLRDEEGPISARGHDTADSLHFVLVQDNRLIDGGKPFFLYQQ